MAKAFNPALEASRPRGSKSDVADHARRDMMEMMFGNTFNKDGLDAKTRLLLTLAG
jgi:4-carboxymuconolactone decarboxylase